MAQSELHRDYILELENELLEFEKKADNTTKRMKMLVYPAMVAFFILAAFGFYLIFSLTSDVRRMADTFVHMSGSIEGNMNSISKTMNDMSGNMDDLVGSTKNLSGDVSKMTGSTAEIVDSMSGMRSATYDMAASTNNMQRDMWSLNKNISTPLSFMNNFLPWKDSQSMPFQGSPKPQPKSYFSAPRNQAPGYGRGPYAPIPIPVPNNIPQYLPANPAGSTVDTQSMFNDPVPIAPIYNYTMN